MSRRSYWMGGVFVGAGMMGEVMAFSARSDNAIVACAMVLVVGAGLTMKGLPGRFSAPEG